MRVTGRVGDTGKVNEKVRLPVEMRIPVKQKDRVGNRVRVRVGLGLGSYIMHEAWVSVVACYKAGTW